MFKVQTTHISVLHKTILLTVSMVWSFTAFNNVYADGQSFFYASDVIQGKRNINSERDVWQYQNEIPLTFRNNNPSQNQYTYLPPTQKVGSNPISNPQHRYQLSLNNNADKNITVAGNGYNYLPPIQKIGTNPFIKPNYQFVDPHKMDQFFASSCDCENSNYKAVLAGY